MSGKTDWNRSRIKRIVEDKRYIGDGGYLPILTEQEYAAMQSIKAEKNTHTHYEERIRTEPKWSFVGIFADKGITGTSMKKRDEFNKMLRLCYKGKIDMIIVKSISRFARNTLDVIKITRKLREINVDVYFEEQGNCRRPGDMIQ